MTPRFKHDDDDDEFLGHFFGHDVYLCDAGHVLILARYGDNDHDYASCPRFLLLDTIVGNGRISGRGFNMTYQDYIFSDKCIPATKAMILGLVMKAQ